ncbi:MAG: hypothetical protein ACOC0J_00155 [Myxococcota bacterium]
MCYTRQGKGLVLALSALLLCSCGPPVEDEDPGTGGGEAEVRSYTYRAIGGVSMGAMGATMIGTRHPELFDAIGGLGGPMDYVYLLNYMRTQYFGGFCSYEDILAILEEHPENPEILNDPEVMDECAVHPAPDLDWEHQQSFNHWHFDDNGGTFHRSAYLDKFEDLSLALGNPVFHNPDSPFFPPGMNDEWDCSSPLIIKGYDSGGSEPIFDEAYNPEGRFDVVSFCDGHQPLWVCEATGKIVDFCSEQEPGAFCGEEGPPVPAGPSVHPEVYYANNNRYDPCRPPTRRVFMTYAVDFNGNGRRDYGEPVIHGSAERFDDVGVEGEEERYHWLEAPLATAGNWLYDEGEPFSDHGLDGVPDTGSYGEGDGVFTLAPNIEKYLDHDPRTRIASWSPETLETTDVYLDGGVRDIMNFGVTSAQVFGLLSALSEETAWYDGFTMLPSFNGSWRQGFRFDEVDWSRVPRNVFVRYGDPDAEPSEVMRGDGGHVGTNEQALNRFNTFFSWLGAVWPDADYDEVALTGELRAYSDSYYSPSLGSERMYSIALPPGYNAPENADETYPVVYFLHGFGMGPDGFLPAHIVYDEYMTRGQLPKMIMVYGDGRCCYLNEEDGSRDCLLEPGKTFEPPWRRECRRGSFFVNRSGRFHGDATPYEDSIIDLMRHVESTYRVAVPESERIGS